MQLYLCTCLLSTHESKFSYPSLAQLPNSNGSQGFSLSIPIPTQSTHQGNFGILPLDSIILWKCLNSVFNTFCCNCVIWVSFFLLTVRRALLMICWERHTQTFPNAAPTLFRFPHNIHWGNRVYVEMLLWLIYYHLLLVLLPSIFIQKCGEKM